MEGSSNGNRWTVVQGDSDEVTSIDCRLQLPADARRRIVNKIMDTLKRCLPISGPEGLGELKKIAMRFEEKIYAAATSQADYLRNISMKMLTMEQKTQGSGVTANLLLPTTSSITTQNTADPAANLMESQVQSQGSSIQIPVANQPQTKQLLAQNLQNNTTPVTVQNAGSLSPALTSIAGSSHSSISSLGQNPNMPTMDAISQNLVNSIPGQSIQPKIYSNEQRQMQGRQLQPSIMPQLQPQKQLLYEQQLIKQNMHQSSLLQSQVSQQQQPPLIQSSVQSISQSGLQQNQQNLIQQAASSLHQQHSQSLVRQQTSQQPSLNQQTSSLVQQPAPISQKPVVLPSQQQIMGNHQLKTSTILQKQLHGQHNNMSDLQQQLHQQKQHQSFPGQGNGLMKTQQPQHMINQQNISSHHQRQNPSQSSMPILQQQQSLQAQHQSRMLGSLAAVSNMQHQHQMHILQHSKASGQQAQQSTPVLSPLQGHQSLSQSSQQKHMPPLQTQAHLQQQTGMQQMQQRFQASGMMQSQNAIEQQKQQVQSEWVLPDAPSTSVDSTAQMGHTSLDWQEEIYQKIKSMKEMYLPDLQELSQRISLMLLQQESLVLSPKQSEQLENYKKYKVYLERIIQFVQLPKNNIQPGMKDKISSYEKQIVNMVTNSRSRRTGPSQPQRQQQHPHSDSTNLAIPQLPSQASQLQKKDGQSNQMQPMNFLSRSTPESSTAMHNVQSGSTSLPAQSRVSTMHQNLMSSLQSNVESLNTLNSAPQSVISSPQTGDFASLQQNNMTAHQSNVSTSQNTVNTLQPNVTALQSNLNILQNHVKQEPQHNQHQMVMQKHSQQQTIQQRMQQQHKQHSSSQLQGNQMQQLHQMNDMNDMKMRKVGGIKSPSYLEGQRQAYHQQQLKFPPSFPISSHRNPSPQIYQHSSPQIDQQTLVSPYSKNGVLQSVNPSFVVSSPSSPLAPSPLPVEHDKQHATISSISNVRFGGPQQSMPAQLQSLAVGTRGFSASPLLAEFANVDVDQANSSAMILKKQIAAERPLERLIKVMNSSSSQVLASSASDILSAVSMFDRIAGSAPGNGSRASIGEDLVAMTKCHIQAINSMSQDDGPASKKIKRHISALSSNVMSSAGSVYHSLKQSSVDTSELESTAMSSVNKKRIEVNHALLEEIRCINQQLIDTAVDVIDEDVDSWGSTAEYEGTVVKFSYCAVALSPSLKLRFASAKVTPILPLRLVIPDNYPFHSPVLLDKIPEEQSIDSEDLSEKARSRFSRSLRGLSQPMSLEEMARTWDVCARTVILEYAQQNGGGTFSSRCGTWTNCATA